MIKEEKANNIFCLIIFESQQIIFQLLISVVNDYHLPLFYYTLYSGNTERLTAKFLKKFLLKFKKRKFRKLKKFFLYIKINCLGICTYIYVNFLYTFSF